MKVRRPRMIRRTRMYATGRTRRSFLRGAAPRSCKLRGRLIVRGRFSYRYCPTDFPIFILNCQPRLATGMKMLNASDRPTR